MRLFRNNKGFTLIELMAVLIILGVIVGIAVPRLISFDKSAEGITTQYEDSAVRTKATTEYYMNSDKSMTLEEYVQKRIQEEREK